MTTAWVGLAVAIVAVVATGVIWVPSRPRLPVTAADIDADFTAEQRQREESFHQALRRWGYLSLFLGLMIPTVLTGSGFVARLTNAVTTTWVISAGVAVTFISLTTWLLGLLPAMKSRQVMVEFGLATGSWARWWRDAVLAELIGLAMTIAAVLALVAAARNWPDNWWIPVAVGAVLVVLLLSFVLPVVIEPLFNSFTPLAAGDLRNSLLALAQDDGVQIREVLVADASKRTSALNAYVSGLGPTRRIVVHDNLLDRGHDDEVVAVVAHELGHVVAKDVFFGTVAGAGGAAAVVFGSALLLNTPAVLAWGHIAGAGDPAVAGVLLTGAVWLSFLLSPLMNGISRRIEREADEHCFDLTHDPDAVVRMHQALALHNIAALQPHPLRYTWFASHPSSPERIKAARLHG